MISRKVQWAVLIVAVALALGAAFNFGPHILKRYPNRYIDDIPSYPHDERLGSEVAEADHYFYSGDKAKALMILRTLIKQYPDSDGLFYLLGTYLMTDLVFDEKGAIKERRVSYSNVEEALSNLKKASELVPGNIPYQLTYALLLTEVGRDKEAASSFSHLLADDQIRKSVKYRYAVINYANVLIRLNRREDALKEYQKSLAATGNDKKIADEYDALLLSAKK